MLSTAESTWSTVPVFKNGRKISKEQQYVLWEHASQHPEFTSSAILQTIKAEHGNFNITTRHVNRLRQEWGLNRKKGRPSNRRLLNTPGGELVKLTPNLPFVGVCILDAFVEQNGIIEQVVTAIQIKIARYKEEHPEETFPLLSHKRQTITMRFKALFYAAFFGIGKLTEYDVKEHGLEGLIGRSYQNNTLRQFLGELERIDVADTLISLLTSSNQGQLGYIDGHMIPFWTGAQMHKGKITMLGRIMPGSNAVVAHNEKGQAIFMDYYPPDIRMPTMILEYCEKIVDATDIRSFVIDREVNSVKIAREFKARDNAPDLAITLVQHLMDDHIIETNDVHAIQQGVERQLREPADMEEFEIRLKIADFRTLVPDPNILTLYLTAYIIEDLIKHPKIQDVFGDDLDVYNTVDAVLGKLRK